MRPWLVSLVAVPALFGEVIVLENSVAKLGIETAGGAIVDFELKSQKLNPLTWSEDGNAPNRLRGHFICFDRWGAPSDAEKANGMPFHGEGPRVTWEILAKSATDVTMQAKLPMAGLAIQRTVRLEGSAAEVTEKVKNLNPLGRVYNLVQHPSIAPPFLDETTVVDSNARKGFSQSSPLPNPEEPSFAWPQAIDGSRPVDIRYLRDNPEPNVVSYVIDEDYGWTSAVTPAKRLMLAYVWKTAEYPWFNAWRHVTAGKPAARGLEFGTTGLHQPYPILARKGRIFGRPLFAFLDTGEEQTRTYWMFLAPTPAGSSGVESIRRKGPEFVVQSRKGGEIRVTAPR